jgi:hypothetical protein
VAAGFAATSTRHVLVLESKALMVRLAARQDEMVALFSRLRNREALLAPFHSLMDSMDFSHLVLLSPDEQQHVTGFRELVNEMKWYLMFTEDMPTQVQLKLTSFIKRLEVAFSALSWSLGHAKTVEVKAPVSLVRASKAKRKKN